MCLDQTKNPHDVERSYPETHPLFFRCMNQIHLWHQGAVPSKAWKQQELRTSSLLFTSLECVRYREQESCPENWMRCLTDKFVMSPAKELEGRAWHRCVCVCMTSIVLNTQTHHWFALCTLTWGWRVYNPRFKLNDFNNMASVRDILIWEVVIHSC